MTGRELVRCTTAEEVTAALEAGKAVLWEWPCGLCGQRAGEELRRYGDGQEHMTYRRVAEDECATLRAIVVDLHWQARRYCDGRATYVTGTFNRHTRALLALGVPLNRTGDGTVWARDAMGRGCDGLSDEEAGQGRPPGAATVRAWRDEEWAAEREALHARLAEREETVATLRAALRELAERHGEALAVAYCRGIAVDGEATE